MVPTGTEGHDSSPEVARVEGYVNTRERDGCEATLESDVSLLRLELLCLREAGVDDLAEHLLDLVDGELLRQLY